MNTREDLIEKLEKVDIFEDKFTSYEDEFTPLHWTISNNKEFITWCESAKAVLYAYRSDTYVSETIDLINSLMHSSRSLNEKEDYDELRAKIHEIMERVKQDGLLTFSENSDNQLPTVFISYNQKSGGSFVDELEKALEGKATVYRDIHSINTWGSISHFMQSIRDQDLAVLVITDEYLKSSACLYEVMEQMQEKEWLKKTLFAVRDCKSIYTPTGRSDYVEYWQDEFNKLNEKLNGKDNSAIVELNDDLRRCQLIKDHISKFLKCVSNANNPPEDQIIPAIVKYIEGRT